MLPKEFKFSIPRDHPKAAKLISIFDKLATSRERVGGLVIDSGITDDSAVQYVLGELRDLLVESGVDLNDLVEKSLHRKPAPTDVSKFLRDPSSLTAMLAGLAGSTGLSSVGSLFSSPTKETP